MKNVFLSVVIICALTIAGVGGVFADYQDIETSHDNYFETGSLDLLVSDMQGNLWEDPNVPVVIDADNIMPECQNKSFHFNLENVGDYEQGTGWVYLHVKNAIYSDSGRTEPEDAVERNNALGHGNNPIGELADGTFITSPGWGANLDELGYHMEVAILTAPGVVGTPPSLGDYTNVDLSDYDLNGDGYIKFNELVCNQILIGELDSEETIYVWISLWFQDIPEEHLRVDLDYFDESNPAEAKWNDWPTNALQDDQVDFDISFELFQFLLPPPNNG